MYTSIILCIAHVSLPPPSLLPVCWIQLPLVFSVLHKKIKNKIPPTTGNLSNPYGRSPLEDRRRKTNGRREVAPDNATPLVTSECEYRNTLAVAGQKSLNLLSIIPLFCMSQSSPSCFQTGVKVLVSQFEPQAVGRGRRRKAVRRKSGHWGWEG